MDLLEKSFILKKIGGYNRNLRKEISKCHKIYFLDLGIRNALIDNFSPLNLRDDTGKLWENFLFIERYKLLNNSNIRTSQHFWRLQTGAEHDYVEEIDGQLSDFEFKYGDRTVTPPKAWQETYPKTSFQTINRENWLSFLLNP